MSSLDNGLQQELKQACDLYRSLAKRNYLFAYAVTLISVFSSIAAGILVLIDSIDPVIIAVLAALPAGMMSFKTVCRFEEKSSWFWQKTKYLEKLYRALSYEGADPTEISQRYSDFELEMEANWVSFGATNTKQAVSENA